MTWAVSFLSLGVVRGDVSALKPFCAQIFGIATGYSDSVVAACKLRREENFRLARGLPPLVNTTADLKEPLRSLFLRYTAEDGPFADRWSQLPQAGGHGEARYELNYLSGKRVLGHTAITLVHSMMSSLGGHNINSEGLETVMTQYTLGGNKTVWMSESQLREYNNKRRRRAKAGGEGACALAPRTWEPSTCVRLG